MQPLHVISSFPCSHGSSPVTKKRNLIAAGETPEVGGYFLFKAMIACQMTGIHTHTPTGFSPHSSYIMLIFIRLLAQRTIILLLKQSVKCAPEKDEFLNPPLPLPRPPWPGRTHLNHSSVSRKTLPVRAPSSFYTHLFEIHHDQSSRNLLVYLKTCFKIQNKTKINLNLPPIFILTLGRKN